MLNKAHFHELAADLSRNVPNGCPWTPMELLIRDNIAAILETKVKVSMGGFGFLERNGRERATDISVKTFNFVVGHPEYRMQMQCSFYNEAKPGTSYEFHLNEGFSMMFVNTAPEPEKTAEELAAEKERGGIRSSQGSRRDSPYRLDREDFDPVMLDMFKELLSSATMEVMIKAIPERKALVSKTFKEGDMVYNLHTPDKVLAAHVVEVCGVNTVSGEKEVCDMAVFDIAMQKSRWVHSSDFGTELDWNKAMKGFGSGHHRHVEYEGATAAEVDYIQSALVRIGAILRG